MSQSPDQPVPYRSGLLARLPRLRQLAVDLHQRRVYRAVVTYALAAWLVLQIADIAFPLFGVSPWIFKLLVCASALGLPVTVVAAWIYEITPNGVVVDAGRPRVRPDEITQDLLVALLAIGAVAVFLVLLLFSEASGSARVAITATDLRGEGATPVSIAPGLEQELRRQLAGVAGIEPVSVGNASREESLVLWVSVRAQARQARVWALLTDAAGERSYPYIDEFEVLGATAAEMQQQAARRIATRLRQLLVRPEDRHRLSGLFWSREDRS